MDPAKVVEPSSRESPGGPVDETPITLEDARREIEHLRRALVTRTVIGQAIGILMERGRITADEAFDALKRASQRANVKLAQIAEDLTETGEWPAPSLITARSGARSASLNGDRPNGSDQIAFD